MVNWTYQWFDADGRYTGPEIAEQFTKLFLRGVEKP
jgi:hypothetical protein